MSWVFLTDIHAYKLKKPVRYEFLDYSTLEARRRTCEEEVRLNRRLAADVYCGIVPLTLTAQSNLQLEGEGEVIDWLVKMRRLPDDRMLDHAIATRTATEEDARKVGAVLATFYRNAPAVAMTASDYRGRLAEEISSSRQELARPGYRLPVDSLDAIATAQLKFLEHEPEMFDERVAAGKVVEAHGDLRPEHICLEGTPVIIDCLEFNRALRILDVASELAFLWLECERLGAPEIGRVIFETYCRTTGDRPPPRLIGFYKGWHACVRAKVAVWHLKDHAVNHPAKWIEKAGHYLRLAAASISVEPAPSRQAFSIILRRPS